MDIDKGQELEKLRQAFKALADLGGGFDECLVSVLPALNRLAVDTQNWQLMFDLLHWDWQEGHLPVSPDELDQLSTQLSPFSDQAQVVQQQQKDAQEWGEALKKSGLTPGQALSLAKLDLEMEAEKNAVLTQTAAHPSPLSLPLAIVRQYRQFYRADKRYNPSRSNALKPLLTAIGVIRKSGSDGEDLANEVAGAVLADMNQVHANTAKGRWVEPSRNVERSLIADFAGFMVYQVLGQKFRGDKSQFSSKSGIGLIEDACYFLYLMEQEKENSA